MHIDPNTGGMFFQVLAVVAAAETAMQLIISRHIHSPLALVRRRIMRLEDGIRARLLWRD